MVIPRSFGSADVWSSFFGECRMFFVHSSGYISSNILFMSSCMLLLILFCKIWAFVVGNLSRLTPDPIALRDLPSSARVNGLFRVRNNRPAPAKADSNLCLASSAESGMSQKTRLEITLSMHLLLCCGRSSGNNTFYHDPHRTSPCVGNKEEILNNVTRCSN